MPLFVLLLVLVLYLIPIAAAIWLLRTVAHMARTLDDVSQQSVAILEALSHRDIG